jgi:glycogen(starch) synthase
MKATSRPGMKRSGRVPRHVLMTADTVGGVWTYATELCAALASSGVNVTLATMGRSCSVEQRREAARLGNVDLCESTYKLEWMKDCWDNVDEAGEWLLNLARDRRVDLVHLNGYVHAALRWDRPVLAVAHSCVLSWWQAVRGTELPAEWHTYRQRVASGLASADLVVGPTHAMLGAIRRHYGYDGPGIVISNARRSECPTETKQSFVFAAGRLWDEAKNVLALDQIATGVPWPVIVAGDTRAPDGGCVSTSAVGTLGNLAPEMVRKWMARAAIYALPARYEPFGLSVLEAATAGCALVLGDIGSLRENWSGAAAFVNPNDSEALRDTLVRLIDDSEHRATLAAAAAHRARSFAPERQRAGYVAAYRQLMAGRRERATAHPPWEKRG